MRLLIAEDNAQTLRALSGSVDWSRIEIEVVGTAETGPEAQKAVELLRPDIVLTDVVMPGMTGLELIRRFSGSLEAPRFVVISAFGEFENVQEALRGGADDYLLKPLDFDEVLSVVAESARRRTEQLNLSKRVEEARPLMRERLLRELVYGTDVANLSQSELEILDLADAELSYTVAILIPETGSGTRPDMWTLIEDIEQAIASRTPAKTRVVAVTIVDRSVVILLTNRTESPDLIRRHVDEFVESTLQAMIMTPDFEVTAVVGPTVRQRSDIVDSYRRARETSTARFFLGTGGILHPEEAAISGERSDVRYPDQEESELLREFRLGHQREFAERLEQLLEAITDQRARRSGIVAVLSSVYARLLHARQAMSDNSCSSDTGLAATAARLESSETISSLTKVFRRAALALMEDSSSERKTPPDAVVTECRRIATEEFAKPELSVAYMADRLRMSPSYLGAFFHRSTEEYLGDVITEVRMARAREFLESTELKVYEVAERVGYRSQYYFNARFKRHHGVTPLQYRKTFS